MRAQQRSRITAGLLGLAGLIGAAAGAIHFSERSEQRMLTAFERAVVDENFRDDYCRDIYQRRKEVGTPFWDGLSGIVYDPGLRQMESRIRSLTLSSGAPVYQMDEMYAATPVFNLSGRNETYVNNPAFEHCKKEDDFFSLIDNEASHAMLFFARQAHLPIPPFPDGADVDVWNKTIELLSDDYQFSQIHNGRRKVSEHFQKKCVDTSQVLFADVKKIAEGSSAEGDYARKIVDLIRKQPTRHYFE